MKIREMLRRSSYVAAVTVLCFGPGAFAQGSSTSVASASAVTRSAGVFVLYPFREGKRKKDKDKKGVAAPEGGSAALYLLLAGLTCCGAMFMRSRQARTEESAV
jgi:hypothetical protein